MARRIIDGPPGGRFLSLVEAAEWMGISDDLLEELIEANPWMLKKRIKSRVMYDWHDVYLLGAMVDKGIGGLEPKPKQPAKAKGGEDDG